MAIKMSRLSEQSFHTFQRCTIKKSKRKSKITRPVISQHTYNSPKMAKKDACKHSIIIQIKLTRAPTDGFIVRTRTAEISPLTQGTNDTSSYSPFLKELTKAKLIEHSWTKQWWDNFYPRSTIMLKTAWTKHRGSDTKQKQKAMMSGLSRTVCITEYTSLNLRVSQSQAIQGTQISAD